MAMIDQEDEFPQPLFKPTPVGPMATPQRMASATPGMTAPESQQEVLSRMTGGRDSRYGVYEQKARMRMHGVNDQLRLQSIQQAMQRHEAFSDLEGVNPPHENRISLHTPTGYTHDQSIGADWQKFSPEMRAVHEGATKQFNRELSQLLGGSDQSAWATTSDYEQAIQSLPSVRKYGSIIEGYARNTALRQLAPEMQAKFKANDQNFIEFQKWYRSKGFGAGGQSAEAAWDEMHGTGPFAGQPTQRGSLIAQQWENDPSVKKFDVDPATLQLRERPMSQQQRLDMQLQQQGRMREAEEGPRLQALSQQYESLPPDQKRLYMKPIAGDKELKEFPKAEKPKEGEFDSPEEAKARAAEMTQRYGEDYEATYKGGKHIVQRKSEGSPYKLDREQQIEASIAARVPVFKIGKTMIMKGDKLWDEYVDAYIGDKKATPQSMKMAEMTGERVTYRVKPEYKDLEYKPDGQAAKSATKPTPQAGPLTPEERSRLEELRKKYGGR